MELLTSKDSIELGEDNKVELSNSLKTFLEAQPKIVNFDEVGKENAEIKIDEKKEDNTPEDVKSFYTEKMGLSEEDANKAYKDAKNLSDIERENKKSTIF